MDFGQKRVEADTRGTRKEMQLCRFSSRRFLRANPPNEFPEANPFRLIWWPTSHSLQREAIFVCPLFGFHFLAHKQTTKAGGGGEGKAAARQTHSAHSSAGHGHQQQAVVHSVRPRDPQWRNTNAGQSFITASHRIGPFLPPSPAPLPSLLPAWEPTFPARAQNTSLKGGPTGRSQPSQQSIANSAEMGRRSFDQQNRQQSFGPPPPSQQMAAGGGRKMSLIVMQQQQRKKSVCIPRSDQQQFTTSSEPSILSPSGKMGNKHLKK
jgi:hypothetical protein